MQESFWCRQCSVRYSKLGNSYSLSLSLLCAHMQVRTYTLSLSLSLCLCLSFSLPLLSLSLSLSLPVCPCLCLALSVLPLSLSLSLLRKSLWLMYLEAVIRKCPLLSGHCLCAVARSTITQNYTLIFLSPCALWREVQLYKSIPSSFCHLVRFSRARENRGTRPTLIALARKLRPITQVCWHRRPPRPSG